MTCSDATWLRWRAYVDSGCSGPTGGQSNCCLVQVLVDSPQGGEGLRQSRPPEWTLRERGEQSPPERATGVDLSRPWRAVSTGAGHRSGLESLLTIR